MPEIKKEAKKEPKRKPVGFHLTENEIYELGFDGVNTYFICHNFSEGGWKKVIKIPINEDLILVPLFDDLIEKGVIHLPVAPEPYGTEQDLYDLVQRYINEYVAVSQFYERLSSYYVLFSWLYDRFNTLPYERFIGDYGTGKTRALQVIGAICYRPVFASGATTVSPIFRLIDRHQGTLIIDEADFKNSDSDAEIMKILNCGYQAGFPVIRSEQRGNTFEPVGYAVYGPKLIATRKRFRDKALESRCLTEEMDFQWRPDIPSILPDTFWDEALEIRNRLLQWRFDKYPDVKLRNDRINESIEPRLNQVMMPLASIIEDETMLGDLREFAEKYNKNIVVERGMLLEAQVLQAIVDLAQANERNISPSMKEIANQYNKDRTDKEHITPHKAGRVVGDRLKLEKVNKRGLYHLVWDGPKMRKLCERYGVLIEGVDFGGLVDFVDSLCEPPRKSTGDKKRENSNGVDFPSPSHRKSTKSTTQHKPTPQGCGECDYYLVERGWIGCKKMEQKLRNMDSCPLEPG
jgi:hypothetical protein